MNKLIQPVLIVILLFLMTGCGSNPKWYKPGCNQFDFNLDDLECQRSAVEFARQATLLGEKMDPEVFARTYNNCIFSKGWTHTPPGFEQNTLKPVILAEFHGNSMTVFGRRIGLPSGLNLVGNQVSASQDLRVQSFSFQGGGSVFLTIIVQETLSRKFEPVDYPVNEPLFVFEQGEGDKDPDQLRWSIFAGKFQGEWVAGIGGYFIADKKQRVTFVMTKSISSPENTPPKGLRLTKKQKQEVSDGLSISLFSF